MADSLSKKNLLEASSYIIARARDDWSNTPFLPSSMLTKSDRVETSALAKNLTYSGYMKMGDNNLAIINGIEYEAGDELDHGGYIVKNIFPTRVVIGPAGEKNSIILPLEETKTFEKQIGRIRYEH